MADAAGRRRAARRDAGLASSMIGSHRIPTWVPSGIFFAPLAATGRISWLRVAAIGAVRTSIDPNVRPSETSDGVTGGRRMPAVVPENVPVAPDRTWLELTPCDTSER